LTLEEKARAVAEAAAHRRASDILLLDLSTLTPVCDYFVLCTGRSTVHVKAIANEIINQMADQGIKPGHVEGLREGSWVLLDFLSVVAHVFTAEAREYYQLEQLWWDAPREEIESLSGLADGFDDAD
jgi:ribosome-associated protein